MFSHVARVDQFISVIFLPISTGLSTFLHFNLQLKSFPQRDITDSMRAPTEACRTHQSAAFYDKHIAICKKM